MTRLNIRLVADTEDSGWDPNLYQGRSRHQVESNDQIMVWIAKIWAVLIVFSVAYYLLAPLVRFLAPLFS